MENNLAPTFENLFGDYWVLWYSQSNSYSIVNNTFKTHLNQYLQSKTIENFSTQFTAKNKTSEAIIIAQTIKTYLKSCNSLSSPSEKILVEIDVSHRVIIKYYIIRGLIIQIYYDSEAILKTIHPAIAHLCTAATAHTITFDIYIKKKQLYLYKNEQLITCVPQSDYHLMQGQFIMHLIGLTHHKEEDDWIGTFHGSTITDGNSSLLFVGASGKGKSTLCALLTASGFDLLADDVSPMLSGSKNIYYNPSAISIKEGAFSLLQPLLDGFKELPIVRFNKSKGPLKYLPCKPPKKDFYPCRGIILVNFKAKATTKLEAVSVKKVLETLIPESWLSPNPVHAREFLDWLGTVNTYQLTYSDTKSVSQEVSQLFSQLNKT